MHPSWDIAALQLTLAVLLDWFVGEYPHLVHPVVWIGSATKLLLRFAPNAGWWRQFLFGTLLVVLICAVTVAATHLVLMMLGDNPTAQIIGGGILLKASSSLRGLITAARRVGDLLDRNDLPQAREALRSLCSRDPAELEPKDLIAGTVESLAENTSDSVVAPLLFFVLAGLPGAMLYRAINTLDAMIGYRGQYEALGKTAARLDDVANWLPARLTALLFLVAGWLTGRKLAEGWHILRRDGRATPSPNGGRPMAVMAGLLGVQLEKKGVYALGDPINELTTQTIHAACKLVLLTSLLMLVSSYLSLLMIQMLRNWTGSP